MPRLGPGPVIGMPHIKVVAVGRGLEARGHPQQRGFAAAGRADQADEFAFLDASDWRRAAPRSARPFCE